MAHILPVWPTVPAKVKLLYPDAKIPVYMSEHAAGADVFAYLDRDEMVRQHVGASPFNSSPTVPKIKVHVHETLVIPLGFAIEIPPGFVVAAKGRSGMAVDGIETHHGWVDPDYRGGMAMIVHGGSEGVWIEHGQRIGQIAILPCYRPEGGFQVVDELSTTKRGTGGFGSTGR